MASLTIPNQLVNNTIADATEVLANFNAIVTWSTSIDNTNIAAAAGIVTEKLDDHSATAAEQNSDADPGVSGSESPATNLTQEITRLRRKIREQGIGTAADWYDGSSLTDASWIDTPVRFGRNLLRNSTFSVQSGAANSAPDGWALVGTPATVVIQASDASEGDANECRVVADAATEGISQTLDGLKPSTKYLFIARVKVNVGTCRMETTGGLGAGDFQNFQIDSTGTSFATLAGIISTDATPTDLVVRFVSLANLDDFDIAWAGLFECGVDPLPQRDSIFVQKRGSTNGTQVLDNGDDAGFTGRIWEEGTNDFDRTVYVPGPNYRIHVRARMSAVLNSNLREVLTTRLFESVDGGGATAVDLVQTRNDDNLSEEHKHHPVLQYTLENPVPGSSYRYVVTGKSSSAVAFTPQGNSQFSSLEIEVVPYG